MAKDLVPIVEFCDITFGYTPAMINLNNVSFKIYPNEYVCVIGHNGSGKSTISKVLSGLLTPQKGYLKIHNQKIDRSNIHLIRQKVGMIFQNPDNQFVGLTVEDDVAFSLENHRILPQNMQSIINIVTKATGVNSLLKVEPSNLSGGQKQRVAIASVLSVDPEIIIFDESTSMLDPNAKEDLKSLILDLKNKYNKTIISVTHDMEEITKCDKLIVVNHGKILKIAPPEEIFQDRA
jgi:energy-coupling factor transport system ATP-binding protein